MTDVMSGCNNGKQAVVLIPTYNERENVSRICAQILELGTELDLVFIDDNSPDGTGQVIDGLAARHKNVLAIHRREKQGIGSAHIHGIRWANEHGYDLVITMDCDFSHSPHYINRFIQESNGFDLVIGSRFLSGDGVKEWNPYRKFLTAIGHFLTVVLLKLPYDATGAFRLYDLTRIDLDIFQLVSSKGYSFFFESLHLFCVNGYKIKEIPVVLPARSCGHSKMRIRDILNSLGLLSRAFLLRKFHPEKLQLPPRMGLNL